MENTDLILSTLENYRRLASKAENHGDMLKDKTTLNFLSYVLDSSEEEVLKCSLETLELLAKENNNREIMKSTFGVLEALGNLKNTQNITIVEKSKLIIELLNRKPSPTLSKTCDLGKSKSNFLNKKKKVITLQVHGLHLETRKELEDILMKKTKGVLSVMVDVEHQRCTATVFDHVDPKQLGKVLAENTNMEARLVTRNAMNQEMLISLSESVQSLNLDDLPPYLDERDSPVKEKAVKSTRDIRITASEWFSTAAGILQKSIYW